MNEKKQHKNGDRENISIKLTQYNNCCLYSLKSKDLDHIKSLKNYLLSPLERNIVISFLRNPTKKYC